MYDLVIIGSGPAGLSAAVYAKRACLDVVASTVSAAMPCRPSTAT